MIILLSCIPSVSFYVKTTKVVMLVSRVFFFSLSRQLQVQQTKRIKENGFNFFHFQHLLFSLSPTLIFFNSKQSKIRGKLEECRLSFICCFIFCIVHQISTIVVWLFTQQSTIAAEKSR